MQPYNPITAALDKRTDAAWGRIFDVSRQSISQWRKYSSIPRHFMRAFAVLNGAAMPDDGGEPSVSVDSQLEYDELMKGIRFSEFVHVVRDRAAAEDRVDRKVKRD